MTFKLSNSIRKNILNMDGYSGGEQSKEKFIRLNTNENPYPVPDIVNQAMKDELDKNELSLYPDESSSDARKAAADCFNVSPEQIMFDNGSASLLSVIFRVALNKNDSIAVASPSFTLYDELVKLQDAKINKIDWLEDYKLPIDDLLNSNSKMIIIVNPNAPTGTEINFKDIEEILKKSDKLVLLDEAYADFAKKSGINLIKKYDNLIVLRTFSKSQSLAGLRVGFAISSKEIIFELNKVRSTYNIDRVKQAGIKAVFENWNLFKEPTEKIIQEREKAYKKFKNRGFEVLESKTNFLLVRVPGSFKFSAKEYYEKLKEKKILVRHFNELDDCLRVSIGLPKEMEQLFDVIDEIAEENHE